MKFNIRTIKDSDPGSCKNPSPGTLGFENTVKKISFEQIKKSNIFIADKWKRQNQKML
jgi:hypothetical protein